MAFFRIVADTPLLQLALTVFFTQIMRHLQSEVSIQQMTCHVKNASDFLSFEYR